VAEKLETEKKEEVLMRVEGYLGDQCSTSVKKRKKFREVSIECQVVKVSMSWGAILSQKIGQRLKGGNAGGVLGNKRSKT